MAADAIPGVPMELTEKDLTLALRATVLVKRIRLFGVPETVDDVLDTETAPDYVTASHTRFRVAAYLEKPIQCPKCHRFGHIGCVCSQSARCTRCGKGLERSACTAGNPRCSNCSKMHESTSSSYPVYKKENEIF